MSPAASATARPAAPLRLGTRGSRLALAQSGHVASALTALSGRDVALVPITSEGDVNRASLASLGGAGVFATNLREALLAGECDLLVHSLKDLPVAPAPGLVIAAIPPRADPRDVVVTTGATLQGLPSGATVGTGSPRRRAQVARRSPGARVRDLRGNVDSRLGRVRDGELDAVVLAAAGLQRMGILPPPDDEGDDPHRHEGLVFHRLGLAEWPTAAGQGALAVEIGADASADIASAVGGLDDSSTRIAVTAERALLAELEAGCHAPVGVHARLTGDALRLRVVVYGIDGTPRVGADDVVQLGHPAGGQRANPGEGYIRFTGDSEDASVADGAGRIAQAEAFGLAVARRLLQRGAAELVSREAL